MKLTDGKKMEGFKVTGSRFKVRGSRFKVPGSRFQDNEALRHLQQGAKLL